MSAINPIVWLLSATGLLQMNGTPVPDVPFRNTPVIAGDIRGNQAAVIVNGHEVWVLRNGAWSQRAKSDLVLNCILWTGDDQLLAGAEQARLAWVCDDAVEFIESFDNVPERPEWNTPWGGPPDVRSLALAADGTIYADIHVGWIVRSRDGGRTWSSCRSGLNKDVHMVAAHPTRPEVVFCATAAGFHISFDHGETFERRTEPMPYYYQRAVACFPDRDVYLCSTSRGPHGYADALLFHSENEGKTWVPVKGLPEKISRNIDTHQIVVGPGGRGYVIVEYKHVFETNDYGATWKAVAGGEDRPNINTLLLLKKN